MNIELSQADITKLVMILGAAQGMFEHQAEEAKGFFKALATQYAEEAQRLLTEIARQHNEAVAR